MLGLLTFEPILKSVIWGGEKIAPFKGIVTDQHQIGESWEISGVPGHESVVAAGPLKGKTLGELLHSYGAELVGKDTFERFGYTFPLLIKIIDAASDLSVQVHPDDELAKIRHNSLGKTEMWCIIDSEPGAKINAGLSKAITPEEYAERVADNTIMDVIAKHESHPGDVFFLPAGRVHSIGGGNMLIEVQETSDITYRIYDFDRRDANGNPRQLHVEESKDAIDFNVYPEYRSEPMPYSEGVELLVQCSHFTVTRIKVDGMYKIHKKDVDTFLTCTCIEGELDFTDNTGSQVHLTRGNSLLVPASAEWVQINGNGVIINSYRP